MMRISNQAVVWCTIVGLTFGQAPLASAAPPTPQSQQAPGAVASIIDVQLSHANVFHGQVVNGQGVPQAGKDIQLLAGGRVVSQATTTADGRFAVKVSQGGIYVLKDQHAASVLRVWTAEAAPPSASNSVLMVSDQQVARANLCDPDHGMWIGLGLFAGAVTAVFVTLDDDDVADDAS